MAKKTKILIIEDDLDFLDAVLYYLEKSKYDVFTSINGKDGVESIKKRHPELIILDLMLPGMTGEEVLEWLKESESQIPVIVVTARFLDTDLVTKLQSYENATVLPKPFKNAELQEVIEQTLTTKEPS